MINKERKDLVMVKQDNLGELWITKDSGFKYYPYVCWASLLVVTELWLKLER